jgi:hypothetical protein
MIMKNIQAIAAAAALMLCLTAAADERAIRCDGCSEWQKEQAASQATQQGKVTVFDAAGKSVSRYNVFTEVLDVRPRTTWTSVNRISVDRTLKTLWSSYLESVRGVEHPGVVNLPDDFPMLSVAGALQDPSFTTTAIENHLRSVSAFALLNRNLSSFISQGLRLNLGLVDLADIIQAITIEVVFPDGSSMDYTVAFSINQGTGYARLELEPFGNAMAADGLPVPTSALGFRNRSFQDYNGSLSEWLALARSHGLVVYQGGSNGTVMECTLEGNNIVCRVRPAK